MAGLIYYDNGNKWRYENPGTADLLIVAGTTVTDLPITQSRTSTAFYQTQRVKCFDIPATNEIWIKCDVYHTGTTSRFRIYDDKNGSTANGLATYSNSTEIALWSNNGSGNFERKIFSNAVKSSVLQTYLLHMRTGDTNGLLELWLDGEYKGSYTGNVNNGQIFENIFLQSDSSANLFSNVIISNSEIGIDENVNPIGISWNYFFDTKRIVKNPALAQRIAEATKVLLHFDDENNPWKDECGNEWTAYKSPSIGTDNATFEKGLQLSGGSYIYTSQPVLFGGKDFTIDFWAYAASSQVNYASFLGFKSDGTGGGNGKNSLFFGRNNGSSNLRYGMWNNSGGSLSNQVVDTTFLNRRRHYALVYQHETLQWKIFVDGQLVFSTTLSQAISEIERYIFIGRTPYSGSQYFNGTIDEFRIVDGLAIWTENFTPPAGPYETLNYNELLLDTERNVKSITSTNADAIRNVTNPVTLELPIVRELKEAIPVTVLADSKRCIEKSVELAIDIVRKTANNVTVNIDIQREVKHTWRYENAGTAEGLKVSGTTVTVNSTKSKTGTAFWQTNRVATFPIPATKELWVKFDLYYGNAQWRAYDRLNGNDTGIGIYQTSQGLVSYINGPTSYLLKPQNPFTTNKLYTVLLHMVSDSENGLLECWVDGEKYYSEDFADEGLIYKGNVENGADFANFYLQTQNANNLFSNVIISNERIGLGENVINHGLTSTLDFDVVREVNSELIPISVNFDLVRNINKIWRYENYGTADLLLEVPDSKGRKVTVEATRAQSKYYIGFWASGGTKIFDVPATKEVWMKFDAYADKTFVVGDVTARQQSNDKNNNEIYVKLDEVSFYSTNDYLDVSYNWQTGILHTCLLHMISDPEDGLIEFWIDEEKIGILTGNVNDGNDFENLILARSYGTADASILYVFSNVIISNGEIGFNENCKLPISAFYDLDRTLAGTTIDINNLDFDLLREVLPAQFSVNIYFDLLRKPLKNWRYDNYGTTDLLLPAAEAEQIATTKSKSKYESGFYSTKAAKIFDVPVTEEELWIKFDVAIDPANNFTFFAGGINSETNTINGIRVRSYRNAYDPFSQQTYNRYDVQYFDNGEEKSNTNPVWMGKYEISELSELETCLIHVKIDDTNGVVECWLAGEKKFDYVGNTNNADVIDNICIYSAAGNNLFSNIIISNTEIGLDENCRVPVEVLCDTDRYLYSMWSGDTWRYENYGTADFLSVAGTTVAVPKEQSKYYSGFYQTQRVKCFDIPATNEIWIKCDVYHTGTTSRFRIYDDKNGSTANGLATYSNSTEIALWSNNGSGNFERKIFSNAVKSSVLQTYLLHMRTGDTNGLLELWLDGEYKGSYTGNVNNGQIFENIFLQSDSSANLFSNVIISNAEIGIAENCKVPIVDLHDLQRRVVSNFAFEDHCDLLRNICSSKHLNSDLKREIIKSTGADYDTLRNVIKSIEFYVDIQRGIPLKINVSAIENAGDQPDSEFDTKGIQSIEIVIGEQQLTDQIHCVSIYQCEMLDYVAGKYLDYEYALRVDRVRQQGTLTDTTYCADVDELLYSHLSYKLGETKKTKYVIDDEEETEKETVLMAYASAHAKQIASSLRKQLNFQCTDFVSNIDVEVENVTYNDLIRDLFGWTARIPIIMVNCYLRGDNLYIIQRGHEANTIDLTNLKHTRPTITKELVRMTWGSSPTSNTKIIETQSTRWRALSTPSAKKVDKKKKQYQYTDDGLLRATTTYEGSVPSTNYTKTSYEYKTKHKRKFLWREITEVYENNIMVDRRVTEHTPLDQGQEHVISRDEDGEYLGDVVGTGTGDSRITPYSKSRLQMVAERYPVRKEIKLPGIALIDTSFPVNGDEMLEEIFSCIRWLDRKTQETLTMDIFDYNHVFDFNDKFIFDSKEYYLKSNTAIKNQRITNKQTLTLVRWY